MQHDDDKLRNKKGNRKPLKAGRSIEEAFERETKGGERIEQLKGRTNR